MQVSQRKEGEGGGEGLQDVGGGWEWWWSDGDMGGLGIMPGHNHTTVQTHAGGKCLPEAAFNALVVALTKDSGLSVISTSGREEGSQWALMKG